MLFLSNGASSPTEFPDKVGRANTTGIFSCGDWFPNSNAPGNTQFIKGYLKKYGGTPLGIDSGSAEAYAVGQIIEAVAKKTGSIDNKTIIKTLHSGKWPTVEGYLSWGKYGSPQAWLKAAMNLMGQPGGWPRRPLLPVTDEHKLAAIRRALESSQGHRGHAARLLGISERNLYRKLKEYRLLG